MPDTDLASSQQPNLPPPSGDPARSEKYVSQLITLIEKDKLNIIHTDLSKFDSSSLEDHFLTQLKDYQVEFSHGKHPQSGKDSYIMLFTNLKHVVNGGHQKIILAYMHLDDTQFVRVKRAGMEQVERKRRIEEERRLKVALEPVDKLLSEMSTDSRSTPNTANGQLYSAE